MAPRFLEEEYRPLMRKVGGWTMMLTEDMRRVAPLWLNYTEAVRTSPLGMEVWTRMGDAYVTKENPRPWISEMYGYVFGAARAGVDHTVNREMMLYPTYVPTVARAPHPATASAAAARAPPRPDYARARKSRSRTSCTTGWR